VAVASDNLFASLSPDTPAPMAFATANRVLAETVAIWGRLFQAQPLVPVDIAAMRSMLSAGPMQCHIGVATGTEGATPDELVEQLKQSPFLGGPENLAEAESAMVGIVGGADLSMGVLNDLMKRLDGCFSPNARLIKGGGVLEGETGCGPQIIVVACRREAPSEGPRQLDLFADNPVVSHGRRFGPLRPKSSDMLKGLEQVEPSLGVFAGSDPTKVGQENLDIPTFQRKGIAIDLGGDV
jgi:cell division GTPase FtsZ